MDPFFGGKVADVAAPVVDDVEGDSEQRIVKGQGRDDLGYLDEAEWEIDNSGKRRDPWTYGFGLPMLISAPPPSSFTRPHRLAA